MRSSRTTPGLASPERSCRPVRVRGTEQRVGGVLVAPTELPARLQHLMVMAIMRVLHWCRQVRRDWQHLPCPTGAAAATGRQGPSAVSAAGGQPNCGTVVTIMGYDDHGLRSRLRSEPECRGVDVAGAVRRRLPEPMACRTGRDGTGSPRPASGRRSRTRAGRSPRPRPAPTGQASPPAVRWRTGRPGRSS
jgi:hypothetical protein